jgi:hypothetical protein
MANDEYGDSGKSLEEIAREAMSAIKQADRIEKQREEEEAKAHENALKQEVENRLKKKMRNIQRELDKEEKNKAPEVDTRFLATWTNPDGKGICYIAEHNEKQVFKINRGITLFHLTILGDVLHESWRTKAHTSMSLDALKEKADNILKKSNKAYKKIEDEDKLKK